MQHAIKWKLGLIKLDFFLSAFLGFIHTTDCSVIHAQENADAHTKRKEHSSHLINFSLKAFNTWSNFVCFISEFGEFRSHRTENYRIVATAFVHFRFVAITHRFLVIETALAWLLSILWSNTVESEPAKFRLTEKYQDVNNIIISQPWTTGPNRIFLILYFDENSSRFQSIWEIRMQGMHGMLWWKVNCSLSSYLL